MSQSNFSSSCIWREEGNVYNSSFSHSLQINTRLSVSISDITSCMASRLPSIHSWFFTAHFPHSVQLNSLQVRDSAWPPAPLGWAIICKLWWRSKRRPCPEFLAICRFLVWRSLGDPCPCSFLSCLWTLYKCPWTIPAIVVSWKASETTATLLPNSRTGFRATCNALHREERQEGEWEELYYHCSSVTVCAVRSCLDPHKVPSQSCSDAQFQWRPWCLYYISIFRRKLMKDW